jgi:hypothetical protein
MNLTKKVSLFQIIQPNRKHKIGSQTQDRAVHAQPAADPGEK